MPACLRFLAIDEADMLDLTEDYDQVLVFTTVGDVRPENPGIEGVKLFWVEDGKVTEFN